MMSHLQFNQSFVSLVCRKKFTVNTFFSLFLVIFLTGRTNRGCTKAAGFLKSANEDVIAQQDDGVFAKPARYIDEQGTEIMTHNTKDRNWDFYCLISGECASTSFCKEMSCID